ncbi:MAG TPA: DUF4124 domain-containing protein [Steroidobacteraceae bacterium]|nr:DUF4124 domain-containing protein [Steroidobacteraceae bacterium]
MKNVAWILCLCALLGWGFAQSAPTAPRPSNSGRILYKWVDKDGVTHYGDHVPPEYASQEQHVLNSEGYEIRHQDAQKSAEQMAADDQKRLDAEQRQIRDKNLLSTYASVQEIERLRDQRLTLLADQIKVTNQFLDTLNGRMKKMRADSQRFRPYSSDAKAPSMPDQVAEDLVRLTTDVRTQQQNLKQKRSEESTMSIQFESDIDRFKELKHIQ